MGMTTSGKIVLRKYLNGITTDLSTDNVSVTTFLVTPDGTVFVSGRTISTGAAWVRRITATGSLESVSSAIDSLSLMLFPDGNVYMGWPGCSASIGCGMSRYLTATDQLDAKYWVSDSSLGYTEYFDVFAICTSAGTWAGNPFCDERGGWIGWSFRTGDGNEFVTAWEGPSAVLMQYYPTVRFLATEVTNIKVAQGIISNLILAGLNASGKNVLTLYNTANDAEAELIGPSNEIEMYHLNYVANGNKVLFDGLRFSDNKYVIGEYDLSTNQLNVVATSATKWSDLQSF